MCPIIKLTKVAFISYLKTFLSGKYTVLNKRFGASSNDNIKQISAALL